MHAIHSVILSSIPSPGDWGRRFRLYGIMIALGVIAGLELARRRWLHRGGNPDDMSSIALWAVPAGLIGARLYHVITDNELYRGHWFDSPFSADTHSPLAVWQGGLGIPGGILFGVGVGVWVGHRKGIRLSAGLDAVAPAIPLAQAIGRWGNYFNIELFGRPTTLPWGLTVPDDVAARAGFGPGLTYHPTFLYECLWNLGLVLVLIWIDKKRVIRPGRLFALYIGGYFTGRLWVEALRSDEANKILGLRVNIWLSLLAMAGVALFLLIGGLRRREGDSYEPYTDGHRFDLAGAYVPPPGSADEPADGDAASETADALDRSPASARRDADPDGGDADPGDGGGAADGEVAAATAAHDGPQRASGGEDASPDDGR
jgi:prolipoprotein diacylglyceryl transferase